MIPREIHAKTQIRLYFCMDLKIMLTCYDYDD